MSSNKNVFIVKKNEKNALNKSNNFSVKVQKIDQMIERIQGEISSPSTTIPEKNVYLDVLNKLIEARSRMQNIQYKHFNLSSKRKGGKKQKTIKRKRKNKRQTKKYRTSKK